MGLRFHNTLTGRVEAFETAEPGRARIYVCGPTVYDYAHLGHARAYVVYDVLVRHLRERGLAVTYVRNVTDIDDKIIRRAAEAGEPPALLAARFTEAFQQDMARLGCLPPDLEPKVSEHVADIIALIERLVAGGAAYAAEGDVYFRVEAFPGYGKLSHRKLEDLSLGASGRVGDDEARKKRHGADFALWKAAKPGELAWDSPWGPGRPGWHIECSAMCMRHLGESFDLHGGGLDLVFPHHENEIAQSEAATGKPLARMWLHNGFVEVNKEKMSKSLGNFFTARESFRLVEPEAVRYFVLGSHYRAPLGLDFTVDEAGQTTGFPQIEDCERRLQYLYTTQLRLRAVPEDKLDATAAPDPGLLAFPAQLTAALDDDLDCPVAMALLAGFLTRCNELADLATRKKGRLSVGSLDAASRGFAVLGRVLGLGTDDAQAFLRRVRDRRAGARGLDEAQIEAKLRARIEARGARDFARADALRAELTALGIELMDGPEGTSWRLP